MSVEKITLTFTCCDCGQRDTLDLTPPPGHAVVSVNVQGHLCYRCRLRAQQLSDRRRQIFLASRQTGR